jgi:hypothetical protein
MSVSYLEAVHIRLSGALTYAARNIVVERSMVIARLAEPASVLGKNILTKTSSPISIQIEGG